jgi:hypothetical protein
MVVATALPKATSIKTVPWIRSSHRRNVTIVEVGSGFVISERTRLPHGLNLKTFLMAANHNLRVEYAHESLDVLIFD